MGLTTPYYGWPYPIGTDRVRDGDDAFGQLATAVENTLKPADHRAVGSVYTAATGPGVGGTMWFNSSTVAMAGGCAVAGTFPVMGIRVPRAGLYQVSAYGNMQAGSGAGTGVLVRLFIGDGTNVWTDANVYIGTAGQWATLALNVLHNLSANQIVYWGMSTSGAWAGSIDGNSNRNQLVVKQVSN